MADTAKLGPKLRAMRRRTHMSQVEVAEKLGISPSYLNLIEHNQRPLTATLLLKLAQLFRVELSAFAEEHEARLAADLQEVFGDAIFEEHEVHLVDVRELAANPTVARAILALYRAYHEAQESTRELAGKVFDGRDFLGLNPSHLPSEEVSDVIQTNLNYFPELEESAEEMGRRTTLDRTNLPSSLADYLRREHKIEVVVAPAEVDRTAVRRFDPITRRLFISEALPFSSRTFQLAHQIALLTQGDVFEKVIGRSHLTTPESVKLCRVALANYFAGALVMPYESFYRAAEAMRYDIDLLGRRFSASFEQVCHRLTTLRRPSMEGVPFHFLRVDVGGNVSKRFSASGIRFARFSGTCPRWDVHSAFLTPGRIRTQLSQMPDGAAYFCVARTIQKSYGGYGSPHTLMAVGIGCEVRYARKLVYADGVDVENIELAVPIGISCRLCERLDCEQRAFPPLQHELLVDENFRGVSFYTSAVPHNADSRLPIAAAHQESRGTSAAATRRRKKATPQT